MPTPPSPALNDPARLGALRETGLLDTLPEEAFDRLTRLAAQVVGVPVALLSLVENDRQFFKSVVGLKEPWASWQQTPLSHSFCQHVVGSSEPFVVEDAREHSLVSDNEAIPDLGVIAYAGVPLTTPDGHVLGSFCAIDDQPRAWTPENLAALRDLAAMVMTEVALRSSERRYRLLTEHASDMISTHSLEGVYRYASPASRDLLGYEPEELVGRMAYELFHPDDIPAIERGHAATVADGSQAYTTRYRIRRADGEYVWVETRGKTTSDRVVGYEIVAVTRDISEQKAAEDALLEEREQFEVLTEAIPQLVWTALPDGSLDYVSARVASFFGVSRDAVLGSGWLDVLHPDDVAPTLERWARSLESSEPYEVEFRLRGAEGEYRWHLARALPLRDASGEVTRWFGTNTDITERKDMEATLETERARLESLLESLRRAQHQLVQQEKLASLGRVTAGIAHEIQNPLNFVVNFGELAAGLAEALPMDLGDVSPGVREDLEDLATNTKRVVHHGRRADRIARSMLALARNGAPAHVPTDLNALVDEHVGYACAERGTEGVSVETDYDPEVRRMGLDPDAIGRVLVNLVRNALDALEERALAEGDGFAPRLDVRTRRTVGAVEVLVEDNGPGIAPDVIAHVFDPFYTTKPPGRGTGLGLSLSHETVVGSHGGELTVRTQEGEGTVFTIVLPMSNVD